MKVLDVGVVKIGVAESVDGEFEKADIDALLIAGPMKDEVFLDGEIAGVTDFAAGIAARSLTCSYPIFCGCTTRVGNVRHVSVMTFSGGSLADIADRTLNLGGGNYENGDTLKVFRLKKASLGLLVDTDILLAENWKRISPKCDIVAGIAIAGKDADFGYIPTFSSLFLKPYAVAFASGEIMWGTPQDD